ncbi:MAG: hypothetical protein JWM76_955 [Pseudonocardiales bacterium]|nr:hypothetical protein [Pseudonocardiales bacterium]
MIPDTEPNETEAVQAGAEIEVTGPATTGMHHPKTKPGPVEDDPATAREYPLTTDPEAQTEDSVIQPNNS